MPFTAIVTRHHAAAASFRLMRRHSFSADNGHCRHSHAIAAATIGFQIIFARISFRVSPIDLSLILLRVSFATAHCRISRQSPLSRRDLPPRPFFAAATADFAGAAAASFLQFHASDAALRGAAIMCAPQAIAADADYAAP